MDEFLINLIYEIGSITSYLFNIHYKIKNLHSLANSLLNRFLFIFRCNKFRICERRRWSRQECNNSLSGRFGALAGRYFGLEDLYNNNSTVR